MQQVGKIERVMQQVRATEYQDIGITATLTAVLLTERRQGDRRRAAPP